MGLCHQCKSESPTIEYGWFGEKKRKYKTVKLKRNQIWNPVLCDRCNLTYKTPVSKIREKHTKIKWKKRRTTND